MLHTTRFAFPGDALDRPRGLIRAAGGIGVALTLTLSGCVRACFRGGTRITTPQGAMPINAIRPGMWVVSYDVVKQRVVERRVTRTFRHAPQLWGSTKLLSGVTHNHPIFDASQGDFAPAGNLVESGTLLCLDGHLARVGRESFTFAASQLEPVFNLSVESTETYFADGVLVHNKSPACDPTHGFDCDGEGEPDNSDINFDLCPDQQGGAPSDCDPDSQGGQGGGE